MTQKAKDDLLKAMINEWCKTDGVIVTAVWLLEYGLTEDELVFEFGFDPADINVALGQVDELRVEEYRRQAEEEREQGDW